MALLRVSNFPARYVRGVIEFFPDIEIVKNLIGIDDPQQIAIFFQKAGIPYRPVIAGGKIANFQIEHIWVESQIPFANFHGAVLDEHGKTWIGLDTSIKIGGYAYNEPADIFQDFAVADVRDDYLSAIHEQTLLEYLKTEIEANSSGTAYDEYVRTQTLIPEVLHILPASLQFKQMQVTHEYSEIPDELLHKVRFTAQDSNNIDLFDLTLNTLALSNQQIAIKYEPETIEDHELINSYGGLGNTPAYLVRLRPSLQLNGENLVVGRDGLAGGEAYDLAIELISPNGREKITNTHITGNYAVIGIAAQQAVLPAPLPEEERNAYQLLYEEACKYIDRWNQAEKELAALTQMVITRPIPTVVTLGGVMEVTYLLDTPHGVEWKGVYLDADLKAIETAARQNSQENEAVRRNFMRLSSLQGSLLEHRIFEDDFEVQSISTAKLFQLAHEQQISFLTINQTNLETVLSALSVADAIKAEISNAVNQGLTVEIPQTEMLV